MTKAILESMRKQLETQRVEQLQRSAALAETRAQLERQQQEFDEAATQLAELQSWINALEDGQVARSTSKTYIEKEED